MSKWPVSHRTKGDGYVCHSLVRSPNRLRAFRTRHARDVVDGGERDRTIRHRRHPLAHRAVCVSRKFRSGIAEGARAAHKQRRRHQRTARSFRRSRRSDATRYGRSAGKRDYREKAGRDHRARQPRIVPRRRAARTCRWARDVLPRADNPPGGRQLRPSPPGLRVTISTSTSSPLLRPKAGSASLSSAPPTPRVKITKRKSRTSSAAANSRGSAS